MLYNETDSGTKQGTMEMTMKHKAYRTRVAGYFIMMGKSIRICNSVCVPRVGVPTSSLRSEHIAG
jgi:hypothetical protein